METTWIIVIAVAAVVLLALLAFMWWRRSRDPNRKLKNKFGPEYDRAVERTGDEEAARRDLESRVERRDGFDIRELDPEERDRYGMRWAEIQHAFVDRPEDATREADDLIQEVMRERGYPVEDFEQRARDLSVDHPDVVEHYRAARRSLDGERVSTERHREAMLHLRALFTDLVGAHADRDRS